MRNLFKGECFDGYKEVEFEKDGRQEIIQQSQFRRPHGEQEGIGRPFDGKKDGGKEIIRKKVERKEGVQEVQPFRRQESKLPSIIIGERKFEARRCGIEAQWISPLWPQVRT